MSLFLKPKKGQSSSVGICDRCHLKFYLTELGPDGDIPGLRVCKDCKDPKDRYKLPPRVTEDISLRVVRPDEKLTDA